MKRKCIGVVMSQPDKLYQTQLLQGIFKEAFDQGIHVAIFSTILKVGGIDEFQTGEINIFELMNFDKLDGIIVVPDTIHLKDCMDQFTRKLKKEYNKPVVIIDGDVEGYPSFYCEDNKHIKSIVDHLIEQHGCHDIAFMTGFPDHNHSRLRLAGYLDSMQQHGLRVNEDRIYYGDFWYNEGERVARDLLKSERGLPQAIACASDTMAISVHNALERLGIRVPHEVIVTGYDAGGPGITKPKTHTSALRIGVATGRKAARFIIEQMNHIHINGHIEDETIMIYANSCGCWPNCVPERYFEKVEEVVDSSEYFSLYNFMRESLLRAADLRDCLWTIDFESARIGDFDRFYLCLCEDWIKNDVDNTEEGDFRIKGYPRLMNLALKKEKHSYNSEEEKVDFNRTFSTEEMIPALWEKSEVPEAFFFNALHFNERCFGYVVLSFGNPSKAFSSVYPFWLRDVNLGIESLRRQIEITNMYRKIEENAIIDSATRLLNRNGFNLMAEDIVLQAKNEGKNVVVIMSDLNGLKYINDNYGHLSGDECIATVAKAIADNSLKATTIEKDFRMGGDEFIKLAMGDFTEINVQECIQLIIQQLNDFNRVSGKPYPIHIGIGYCYVSGNNDYILEDIIKLADKNMYKKKMKQKLETGFNPKREEYY